MSEDKYQDSQQIFIRVSSQKVQFLKASSQPISNQKLSHSACTSGNDLGNSPNSDPEPESHNACESNRIRIHALISIYFFGKISTNKLKINSKLKSLPNEILTF